MNNKIFKDKDLWLMLIVHLFCINSFVHVIVIGPILLLILLLIFIFICSIFNYNDRDTIFVFIIIILFILSYIIRCITLPMAYSYLEKNAKNANIKKFINKIKTSWKWRLGILLLSSLMPFTIYNTYNITILKFICIHLFICSYFISYLTLYIWWDIQKLITKHKNEFSKCKNL